MENAAAGASCRDAITQVYLLLLPLLLLLLPLLLLLLLLPLFKESLALP